MFNPKIFNIKQIIWFKLIPVTAFQTEI